jgi:hypothetical protein
LFWVKKGGGGNLEKVLEKRKENHGIRAEESPE